MLKKVLAIASVLSGVLLILFLMFTTPTSVGPFGILAFFLLLYIILLELATLIISFISFLLVSFTKRRPLKHPFTRIDPRRAYYYGSVVALAPILLFASFSFGRIKILDFFLVILFTGLACFLISKRR